MARQRIVGEIILSLLFLAEPVWAQMASPSVIATPPQPLWSELAISEKVILSPLADEWDSFEPFRRKKWLGIAAHFSSLTPEEQRRVVGQMQKWRRLTSEERRIARENYKSARRLPADKRQELKRKWEEYSNLSAEEKERLKKQASLRPSRPLTLVVPTARARARFPTTPLPAWEPGGQLPLRILPLGARFQGSGGQGSEARDQKGKRPSGGKKAEAVENPQVVSLSSAAQPA